MVAKQRIKDSGKKSIARFRVVATNSSYGKHCKESLHKLPSTTQRQGDLRTFDGWKNIDWSSIQADVHSMPTLFVSRLIDIPLHSIHPANNSQTKHLLFIENLPVQAISARVPRLNIRDEHRLHIAKEIDPIAIGAIISRAINGLAEQQTSEVRENRSPIVDAWSEAKSLVVLNASFDRLVVPWTNLEKLLGNDVRRLESWQIDEDGSFLFWPHANVHLGWEQLLQIVDPLAALRSKQRGEQFNLRYGAAIRAVREQHRLSQAGIAGVTERHLRRVEQGLTAATHSVLSALAEAHEMTLAYYLEQLARHCK